MAGSFPGADQIVTFWPIYAHSADEEYRFESMSTERRKHSLIDLLPTQVRTRDEFWVIEREGDLRVRFCASCGYRRSGRSRKKGSASEMVSVH